MMAEGGGKKGLSKITCSAGRGSLSLSLCLSQATGLGSILDTVSKDTEDTALSSILSVS